MVSTADTLLLLKNSSQRHMDKQEILDKKIREYYTRLYRDFCCLKDYQERVENRIHEEITEYDRAVELQNLLKTDFKGQKHLIIGSGTGGLAVVLKNKFHCELFGIEPDADALAITKLKCQLNNIDENHFTKGTAESMNFEENQFDFIHCFTVLEHVKSTKKTLANMIRALKPGGTIYINTPNYNFPYEGHYKIPFPTFLPKFCGYLYLKIIGRKTDLYRTINKVTESGINKLLYTMENIVWWRYYYLPQKQHGLSGMIYNFFSFKLGIYKNQQIFIQKIK